MGTREQRSFNRAGLSLARQRGQVGIRRAACPRASRDGRRPVAGHLGDHARRQPRQEAVRRRSRHRGRRRRCGLGVVSGQALGPRGTGCGRCPAHHQKHAADPRPAARRPCAIPDPAPHLDQRRPDTRRDPVGGRADHRRPVRTRQAPRRRPAARLHRRGAHSRPHPGRFRLARRPHRGGPGRRVPGTAVTGESVLPPGWLTDRS